LLAGGKEGCLRELYSLSMSLALYSSMIIQCIGSLVCEVFVLCMYSQYCLVSSTPVSFYLCSSVGFLSSVSLASVFCQFFVTSSGPWLLLYPIKYL